MFRNYLIVAVRNLVRQPGYSLINIAGLAIGITACCLISLYVLGEFSWNRDLPGGERIYRAMLETESDDGSRSVRKHRRLPEAGPSSQRQAERRHDGVARTLHVEDIACHGRHADRRRRPLEDLHALATERDRNVTTAHDLLQPARNRLETPRAAGVQARNRLRLR